MDLMIGILLGELYINGIPWWLFLILLLITGGLVLIFKNKRGNNSGRY